MASKNTKSYSFEPDYAIAPGVTLLEVIDHLGMTQKELALRTQLTVQSVNRIIKGEQPISYETANRLELATNVSAEMWNNLESQYREQLAKIREKERLESDLEWLRLIPVKELIERELIKACDNKVEQVREALKFYGVSSADAWGEIWEKPALAARRSTCFESRPGAASAWIRIGELAAQQVRCADFDKKQFQEALKVIRSLTVEAPEVFIPKMIKVCADAGVAVVLVPRLNKVPWSGATKWISPNKAMILLSIRGKYEDLFWFSFFHEAGHVLRDSKKDLLINDGTRTDPREVRADEFAANYLIPEKHNGVIGNIKSRPELLGIARELGVSPGIVVGRFHHLTQRWKLFNGLKKKFMWVS